MAHKPAGAAELALQLLVLRGRTGDEWAFERLLEQFGGRTLRYLRGLVGDSAEDVQQDVWLAIYRGCRRMHLRCTGRGAPTVRLEAGASSFAIDWTLVQGELARATRVCAYDRAGMGWSDPLAAGTRASTARDLHNLLTASGERPPYIMVGASRGGLFIRAYPADYPAEVGGLVLSTNSYHCVVARSGHEIHLFEPAEVVQAATDIVDGIRKKVPLPRRGC